MVSNSSDRVVGCLLGGAIGDALGGPYEGLTGPLRLGLTEWRLSDDTQLTLATCEGLAHTGTVEPEAIAQRMVGWFRAGRLFGLGASTFKALSELAQGGHWALVGRSGEMAAGNGAAMRIAPLAFLLDPAAPADRRAIRDVCRITHRHDEAYMGALAVVAAVRLVWTGAWSGESSLLEAVQRFLPDSRVRDRLAELEAAGDRPLAELAQRFGNSGYVVDSVPLAICGAQRIRAVGFEPLLEQLVSAGGDTDTIASMAGQIAGTWLGASDLPGKMVERLPLREEILETAQQFAQAVLKGLP